MSSDGLRSWIEQQSSKLRLPDLNILLDTFLTTPDDNEIASITIGLLGDSPQIQSFLQELFNRRIKAGISSKSTPKPSQTQPKPTQTTESNLFFTDDDVDIMDIAQLFQIDKSSSTTQTESFPTLVKQNQPQTTASGKNNKTIVPTSMIMSKDNKTIEYINSIPVAEKRKKQPQSSSSQQLNPNDQPPTTQVQSQSHSIAQSLPQTPVTSPYDHIHMYPERGNTRHKCRCLAGEHEFYGNCTQCGLILCIMEGEGECFYCGSYIINFDMNKKMKMQYGKSSAPPSQHKAGKGSGNNKGKAKTTTTEVFQETRKSATSTHDPLQNSVDAMLIDTKHMNLDGTGLVCIPNQTFIDYMTKITSKAVGVNFQKNRLGHGHHGLESSENQPDGQIRESSIAIRNQSAYGQTHGQDDDGRKKAIEFRNTLLQRATEKTKRTRVIDEQSDYYEYENNIWLDDDEKAQQAELAKIVEDTIEDENNAQYMALDVDSKGKVSVKYNRVDLTFQGVGAVGKATEEIREKASSIQQAKRDQENMPSIVDASGLSVVVADDSKLVAGSSIPFRTLMRSVDLPMLKQQAQQSKAATSSTSEDGTIPTTGTTEGKKKKKKTKQSGVVDPHQPSTSNDTQTTDPTPSHTIPSPSAQPTVKTPLPSHTKPSQQISPSSHLSGRALLVFQTLQRALKAADSSTTGKSSSSSSSSSAWDTKLQNVLIDDDDDDDYEAMVASLESTLHQPHTASSTQQDIIPLNYSTIVEETMQNPLTTDASRYTSQNAIPLYPAGGFDLESTEPGGG